MEKMNLCEFAGGSIQEQSDRALEQVLRNMQDVNTSYKTKRKINITLEFTQTESRDDVYVDIKTDTKLAAAIPVKTNLYVGTDLRTGEMFVEEYGKQIKGQRSFDPVTGEIFEEKSVSTRYTPTDDSAGEEDTSKILKVSQI